MDPVTIKVAIVGLCTLMNVYNADTNFLPPASLIIPKADLKHGNISDTHIGFIAWDTYYVSSTLDGVTTTTVKTPHGADTSYAYVSLEGDVIQIGNLHTDPKDQLDLYNYVDIAKHSEYWDNIPQPRTYDSHYVPLGRNRLLGTPDENYVAGYFLFGTEGMLATSHPTTQDWIFRNQKTDYTIKRKFMQEVDYSYPSPLVDHYAIVQITLKDLAGTSSDRTITLKAKNPDAGLEFFMGNATSGGMYYLLSRTDPDPDDQCQATHFQAIHMIAHTYDPDESPIPEPVRIGAHCKQQGAHGDSTGYCGPDSKP